MLSKILGRMALVLAAAAPLAAQAASDAPPVQGVWTKHDYTLTYAGFTSHYSCDGIESKVKMLLQAAGARDDLKVRGSCSSPLGSPSRISVAHITFYSLTPDTGAPSAPPAAGAKPEAPPEPGVGAWKTVELRQGKPNWLEGGDCELVEQFDHELLPMFATRNHDVHMTCVPHEYTLGSISVRFEVLAALPKPKAQ